MNLPRKPESTNTNMSVFFLTLLLIFGLAGTASVQAQPFAYVTNQSSKNVSVIDTATKTEVDVDGDANNGTTRIPVGGSNPFGVAVTPDGAFVYVTTAGSNDVSVIDTATNTEVDVDGDAGNGITRIPVGNSPRGVAVTPDGSFVYVANVFSANVSVIDTATNTEVDVDGDANNGITRIPVGTGPQGVALTPDGSFVYVTNSSNSSNNVSVIDTATNTEVDVDGDANNGITRIPVGTTPVGVAVTPDGSFVYVANIQSNNISVIDTATNTEVDVDGDAGNGITRIPVGNGPRGVAVTPDGAFVYVANFDSDNVSVIDTATNTEVDVDGDAGNGITRIPVGTSPFGVAVTPDGSFVYVANFNSDNVSVIDTATNTVTNTVTAGDTPSAFGQFIGPEPDITPPDTSITSGPTGTITVNNATFNWTGTDDVTPTPNLVYAYRLDPIEASFSAFGSATTKSYTNLPNGTYTFFVKAQDQAGNEDQTPASRSFMVNTTIPDITVTPTTLDFGSVAVGDSSPVQLVTVRNDGTVTLSLGAISVGGTNANQFSRAQDNCSKKNLAPNASCTVGARFKPTSNGPQTATLIIPSNDPDENPFNVALSGDTPPAIPDVTVTPLTLSFGNVRVGTNSTQKTVTVKNDGAANLTIGALAFSGPDANQFTKPSDKCSNKTLAPTKSCKVSVRLSPTSTGGKSATLVIPSNDPDENPVNVSLSGSGAP